MPMPPALNHAGTPILGIEPSEVPRLAEGIMTPGAISTSLPAGVGVGVGVGAGAGGGGGGGGGVGVGDGPPQICEQSAFGIPWLAATQRPPWQV